MPFLILSFLAFLIAAPAGAMESSVNDEAPLIWRGPDAEEAPYERDYLLEVTGTIERVVNSERLIVVSQDPRWKVGEIVAVESQNKEAGVVAFIEVIRVGIRANGTYEVTAKLLRQSRTRFLQIGDAVFRLDLKTENPRYRGTTDLVLKRGEEQASARYKPLYTQGFSIGETAQTLWKKEVLVSWYGQTAYGITDWWTVSSLLPMNLLGAPNLAFKMRAVDTDSTAIAAGLSFAKIPNESRSSLNFNFYWDSISSETVVSHTFISLALYSFEQAEDATAIKSLGTSSFQTGYEFILNNWNRLLIGPNYNFEKKALGGYFSYLWIWDQFHFSLSANSTNISSMKLSPQDGYYFFFDAYWRF